MSNSKKIFVSYKYKDADVYPLEEYTPSDDTDYNYTPRHYVNKIIELIGEEHIYKGEKSDEDASHLADTTIKSKLKDKIFDSSVTIVLISPNMWDQTKPENVQWIPNEISYSLKRMRRSDRISDTNAMLAVILPDSNGSYDYAVTRHSCPYCSCLTWHTDKYFTLLRDNMFNKKVKNLSSCNHCLVQNMHIGQDHSYIRPIIWDDFVKNHNDYIQHCLEIYENKEDYEIKKAHE